VQSAQKGEAEPSTKKPSDQPAKSVSAETVPAPSAKGEASSSLSMPEFSDGKQAKGVKDYYNNFLLDGQETYLEYFNEEIGYFILSRNVKETESPF
jgi:hypothetical protein